MSKGEPPWARATIGKRRHTAGIKVDRRIHLRSSWAVFMELGIRILMDIVSSNDCGAVAIFRRLVALILRVQYFVTMAIFLKSAFAIVSSYGRHVP